MKRNEVVLVNSSAQLSLFNLSLCKVQTTVTDYTKMAATDTELINSVYEQVRKTGLPYQIKESGGSIVIRMSSDSKFKFKNNQEKFRFHSTRTFNGSNNTNWRSPQIFSESSFTSKPSFPDITFFQSTPPPQRLMPTPITSPPKRPPPPPPTSAVKSAPESSEPASNPPTESETSPLAFKSTNKILHDGFQLTSTPLNPYRCMKRQVVFPLTPNLFTPSPTQASGSESPMPDQNFSSSSIGESAAALTSKSLVDSTLSDDSSTLNRPSSEKTFTTEDMDALKNLMKHLYEKTKF